MSKVTIDYSVFRLPYLHFFVLVFSISLWSMLSTSEAAEVPVLKQLDATSVTVDQKEKAVLINTLNTMLLFDVPNQGSTGGGDSSTDSSDLDSDGVVNSEDNCPVIHNPSQADSDNDGTGDACDQVAISQLKILPLGDSITHGYRGEQTYRYPLWQMLVDEGANFDFVGSLQESIDGLSQWPDYNGIPFDRDHEGHSGWRADEVANYLESWLSGYSPDVALIHLGTNDVYYQGQSAESTLDDLQSIIQILRNKNPVIKIFLAKIIPARYDDQQRIPNFNNQIDAFALTLSLPSSPVIVVDMASGFDPVFDTHDGVHPNSVGDAKIAGKWYEALLQEGFIY